MGGCAWYTKIGSKAKLRASGERRAAFHEVVVSQELREPRGRGRRRSGHCFARGGLSGCGLGRGYVCGWGWGWWGWW